MRLRSLDERGVPGPWSDPSDVLVPIAAPTLIAPVKNFEQVSNEQRESDVNFRWNPTDGAKDYELTVQSIDKDGKPDGDPIVKVIRGTQTIQFLPVAKKFRWKVAGLFLDEQHGEDSEAWDFKIVGAAIATPVIEDPETKYVQKLTWTKPEFAESYDYELLRRDGNLQWVSVEKKENYPKREADFSLDYPGGRYRLVVIAKSLARRSSRPAVFEFPIRGPMRTPAAIEQAQLLESLEYNTDNYAIASYFLTIMRYSSRTPDVGRTASFSAVGGTGRVGYGHIFSGTNWGFFGVVDMSGFTFKGKTETFVSSEMHAVWRKTFGPWLFRAGGGLSLKELPEVRQKENGDFNVHRLAQIGPHGGFEFWRAITPKLGVQFNTRLYVNLLGLTTPNTQSVTPTISYQAGLLGSLRLNRNTMGFAGYAYRVDNASYKAVPAAAGDLNSTSTAAPGDVNTISVSGHYINLILEWSF